MSICDVSSSLRRMQAVITSLHVVISLFVSLTVVWYLLGDTLCENLNWSSSPPISMNKRAEILLKVSMNTNKELKATSFNLEASFVEFSFFFLYFVLYSDLNLFTVALSKQTLSRSRWLLISIFFFKFYLFSFSFSFFFFFLFFSPRLRFFPHLFFFFFNFYILRAEL